MREEPKKQIPLRLSAALYDAIAAWAADEFRSVNGQIEYLLTQCVRRRAGSAPGTPETAVAREEEAHGSAPAPDGE